MSKTPASATPVTPDASDTDNAPAACTDRIFDGLSERFRRKIYSKQDPRGQIRLHIVQDDLQTVLRNQSTLNILDAGGGMGQMSIWLAQQGHSVVLAEPSGEMLNAAREQIAQTEQATDTALAIDLRQHTIQELVQTSDATYDLIVCHAVLEWLAEPEATLRQLLTLLKPQGNLSLMFFNQHSKEMRHLIGGDFRPILENRIASNGNNGLAPISPLQPETVLSWLAHSGLFIHTWSGVRCFYDYSHPEVRKRMQLDDVLTLERRYAQREPWRSLARYQHVLCQAPG